MAKLEMKKKNSGQQEKYRILVQFEFDHWQQPKNEMLLLDPDNSNQGFSFQKNNLSVDGRSFHLN